MPKIWADTIDRHRRQVNDAILDAIAQLIAEQGPLSVGMSAIAQRAGIGRATLYKYFPDVESILVAWHDRDFAGHLRHLQSLADGDDVTLDDVAALLLAQRRKHRGSSTPGSGLTPTVAGAEGVPAGSVQREILAVLTALLTRLVHQHQVRADWPPELLAEWLFHSAHAPSRLDDEAVSRLVADSIAARTAPSSPPG